MAVDFLGELRAIRGLISYEGVATANGAAGGGTLVCSDLTLRPDYGGNMIVITSGDFIGQARNIDGVTNLGTVTPHVAFGGQIVAGVEFVIVASRMVHALGPSVGLWMFGIVDATQVASTTTVITNNLQNVPDDLLEGQFWMQVIYNSSAPTTAPEGEIRRITDFVQGGALQTFTVDAFTANVEAGDMVAIIHESILTIEILGRGTLDTSSATVPEDSTRPEGVDYFKGCLLMTTEGAVRFQPRRIVASSAAGVFTLDPNNPFTAAPGLVDYIIIGEQTEFIPGVDGVNNRTPSDVIGGKADTAIIVPDDVSSMIRYLKGILNAVGATFVASGTFDTSSATVPADSTRGEANDYFNGCLLIPVAGGVILQPRVIVDYTGVGGIFTVDPNNPFTAVTGNVDYVVIAFQWSFVPAPDAVINRATPDVVGTKSSTAVYAKDDVSDVIRYLKGILDANISASGVADAGSGVGLIRDAARTEVNNWWNGQTVLMLTGAAAFQKRPISDFLAATDDIIVSPDFDAAVAAGGVYVILAHYNQIVPEAADSVLNALTSQVVGRKDDTQVFIADDVSSVIRYLKGILATINMLAEPTQSLFETWQDESGIDGNIWTETDPATGAPWSRGATGAYLRVTCVPNANETARLRSNHRWIAAPDIYGTNTIIRRLIVEFELKLTNVANIDNGNSLILALTTDPADIRTANNIIGWVLLADVLQSLTDDGGAETTDTAFGETLTNWNKLRMEIETGTVRFYINETLVATHATNLPDFPMYLNHYIDTEAGGGVTPELGLIRVWYETIER